MRRILSLNAPANLLHAFTAYPEFEHVVLCPPQQVEHYRQQPFVHSAYGYAHGPKLDPRSVAVVRRAIQETSPDLIHAFYARPLAHTLFATAVGFRHLPIVSHRGTSTPPSYLDPANWVSYLHPRVAAHACVSNSVRDGLTSAGVPSQRCFTTYQSFRHQHIESPGRDALKPWGITADDFVVGTVATIRRMKRIDVLLNAVLRCRDLKSLKVILFGEIRDRRVKAILRRPEFRDIVICGGHQPNAHELISGADVFSMPSGRDEGLCKAIMEAMYQNVCCVVSDSPPNVELIRDGIDGLVTPYGDVAALAAALRHLHATPQERARMATTAHERIKTEFNVERWCDRTAGMYHELLDHNAKPAQRSAA